MTALQSTTMKRRQRKSTFKVLRASISHARIAYPIGLSIKSEGKMTFSVKGRKDLLLTDPTERSINRNTSRKQNVTQKEMESMKYNSEQRN